MKIIWLKGGAAGVVMIFSEPDDLCNKSSVERAERVMKSSSAWRSFF